MEPEPSPAAQPAKSRALLRWAILLAVLLLATALAWPSFVRWQRKRMMVASAAFLDQGDTRSATLLAQQAHSLQPRDPAAVALLAEIAARTGSPERLLWLHRLCDLLPGQAEPLLTLAQAALTVREPATAAQALAKLAPADQNTATAHSLTGAAALMQKDWPAAEEHFTAAARLAPADPTAIINLATLHLRNPQSPQAEPARAQLEKLRTAPATRIAATRILLNDARSRSDTTSARQLATELHAAPDSTPEDRLRLLEELQITKDPSLADALTREQTAAANDIHRVATLARWMSAHGLATRAAPWLDQLPHTIRTQPILLLLRTQCATEAGEWRELRKLTTDDTVDWQGLDFLRFAYAARAAVEIAEGRREPDFPARWERAVFSTAGNPTAISMLASTVQKWGWRAEAADLWWQLARLPSGSRPALAQLWRLGAEMKDTPSLLRTARRIAELEPANISAQNNLAYFLLLRGEELPRAHELAAKNLAQFPDSPGLHSTSLLSLSLQGRHPEATAMLATLPPEALRDPALSASAAAALTAAGQREKARPFLETARASADLLPEERALAERAAQP